MKKFRLALVVFATVSSLARAQDDQPQKPPTEIPDFSNLDDYIYEPKSIVSYGYRRLSGPKLKFFGTGHLATTEDAGALVGSNLTRTYHDGTVSPDARVTGRVDPNGNQVLDPDSNGQISVPVGADGHTNTWSFQNASQVTPDGFLAFHTYSADITDTGVRTKDASANFGMELAVSRDMGKIFRGRASWQLVAGMSINDITGSSSGQVQAKLTSITDLYSLDGQVAPTAPYSAPSSTSESVLDSAGNAVLNSSGTAQTVAVDTTVLLPNQPSDRTTSTRTDAVSVTNRWKLSGAYYTFRAGATLLVPITKRLQVSASAGPALIYAGSTYAVTQTYTPDTGADITDTSNSTTSHLLPGYYLDANVQYELTERTGFYAGALIQGAGEYTQNINSTAAHYSTKIDLSRQQGFRGGMTIRF